MKSTNRPSEMKKRFHFNPSPETAKRILASLEAVIKRRKEEEKKAQEIRAKRAA